LELDTAFNRQGVTQTMHFVCRDQSCNITAFAARINFTIQTHYVGVSIGLSFGASRFRRRSIFFCNLDDTRILVFPPWLLP